MKSFSKNDHNKFRSGNESEIQYSIYVCTYAIQKMKIEKAPSKNGILRLRSDAQRARRLDGDRSVMVSPFA
jgi:hypothetical protein